MFVGQSCALAGALTSHSGPPQQNAPAALHALPSFALLLTEAGPELHAVKNAPSNENRSARMEEGYPTLRNMLTTLAIASRFSSPLAKGLGYVTERRTP